MATHPTKLEMSEPVPVELEVGAPVTLKVKASCPEGCDLGGFPVQVMAADEVVLTSEAEVFTLRAPVEVGEHTWTIVLKTREGDNVIHEESYLVVSFTTRPHTTSMAVWDVPSPVVMNRSFKVKVGVRCSAACSLAGQAVEVCDETRGKIGESRLGETAWPGTNALFVAEVELPAPATEGMNLSFARFPATVSGLPHAEASAAFSFRTAKPPQHRVTVKVSDKDSRAPLEDVDVRLGLYHALTDAQGLASLELPAGVYDLDALKIGYETPATTVEVDKDLMVQVEAAASPENNPDDSQVWM